MTNYSAFHWSEKARKYAETVGTIFNVKGRVNTVADLPISGNKVGDLYLVGLPTDADLIEYAWISFDNITRWERIGYTSVTTSFSSLTGSPNDNVALKNALDGKYSTSNPDGYITGITSAMVTAALGYTPYDASNPNGYTSNTGTVTSVNNVSPVNGNVSLSIPTANNPTITLTQGGVTKGSFTLNQASGDTIALDAGGGSSMETGTVLPFAGSTAPTGCLLCDGSAISRTTYSDLFDVIGTTYGIGDGSTTFNIPNGSTRLLSSSIACKGTGKTIGFNNGSTNTGLYSSSSGAAFRTNMFDIDVGTGSGGSNVAGGGWGLVTDSTKSGIIADLSGLQELNYIIKY